MGIFDSETSTTNYNPVADLQASYLPGIYNAATDLYNQGAPGYYPGSTVAALDPVRAQGLNLGVDAALGSQTSLANNQTGLLNNILSGNDPYTNQLAQQAAASTASSFGQAGTLGSARNYQQANLAASDAILGRQLNASQQVNQAQQNALAPSNTLNNIGTSFQQHNQNILDADKTRYDFQADQPWDHLSKYQGIVTQPSAGAFDQGSTTTDSDSLFNTIVGVGTAIAGLPINQGGAVSRQKLMNHQSGMLAQGGMAPRRRMHYGMLAEGGNVIARPTPDYVQYRPDTNAVFNPDYEKDRPNSGSTFSPNEPIISTSSNPYLVPRPTPDFDPNKPTTGVTFNPNYDLYRSDTDAVSNPNYVQDRPNSGNPFNPNRTTAVNTFDPNRTITTVNTYDPNAPTNGQTLRPNEPEIGTPNNPYLVPRPTPDYAQYRPDTNAVSDPSYDQYRPDTGNSIDPSYNPNAPTTGNSFDYSSNPSDPVTATTDPALADTTSVDTAYVPPAPGVNTVAPGAYAPVDTISTQYDNSNWTRPAAGHGWAVIDGRYQLVPTSQGIQPGGGTTYTPNQIAAPGTGTVDGGTTSGGSGGSSAGAPGGYVGTTDEAGNPAPYLGFDIYDWDGNDSFLTNSEINGLSDTVGGIIGRDYDPETTILTEAERDLVNNSEAARLAMEDIYNNNQVIYGEQTGNNLTSATTGNVTDASLLSQIQSFITGDKSYVIDSQTKHYADEAGSTLNPDGTYNIDSWFNPTTGESSNVNVDSGSSGGGSDTSGGIISGGGSDGVGNLGAVGDFFGGIGDALGITDYSGEAAAKAETDTKAKVDAASAARKAETAAWVDYINGISATTTAHQNMYDNNKAIREAGGNPGDGGGSGSGYNRSPGTVGNIGSVSTDYGVSGNYSGTGSYNPPGTSTPNRVVNTDDCFTGSSIVEIPNGRSRMDGLHIGDKVVDANGNTNTITNIIETTLGDRKQIGFNGNTAFTTEEHPFKIKGKGWCAVNPSANTRNNLEVDKIEVGDVFSNGVEVKSIDHNDSSSDTKLYDLVLDGTHEYIVNGYEVHNKNQGGLIRKRNGYNQGGRVSKLPAWMNFRNQYGV